MLSKDSLLSDKGLAVIEALTRPYDSVWLIDDMKTEKFELYRIDEEMVHLMPANVAVKLEKFSDAFAFYSNLVMEEDRKGFLEAVTPENIIRNTEGRPIYSVPFRRVFDSGIRYYRVEFARLDLASGETGIVTGFKNVDEEVKKEQEVQQSLALRSAVIEALTRVYDSVWLIHDIETQRFELFRIDEKMVHLMPANMASKIERFYDAFRFYSQLVLEEDRKGFLDAVTPEEIERNTRDKLVYSVPFRRVFESGIRYYRVEFARIDSGAGGTRIVGGFKDVDDEVRKEQQIQQALRDAIDAANASNKAKSDFLSSMSHDIRTPMNGIIGMTAIAANNLDDRDRVADCLKKIKDSSNHLLSLINEVLDMNKIESGKIELVEEEFSLTDLVDGMLTMTRPQMEAHGHTCTVDIGIAHRKVIGDSRRIQQVFINIMSNAIKYTPDGGKLSLTVREEPTKTQDLGHYHFVFEDNGYGMTEEFQKHLFEPFARANDSKTAEIQGTGLGMAITRNIVRMMGGDISVESVYGEGSKFTIDLYMKYLEDGDSDAGLSEGTDTGAPLQDLEDMDLSGRRVLLAEDQEINAEIATDFLQMTGLEVDRAKDGMQAVEKLEASPDGYYAMIFMDVQMPNMNGYEATQAIRAMDRPYAKNIPIVAMTANAFADDILNCRKAGMNDHMAKPIDVDVLAGMLTEYIS